MEPVSEVFNIPTDKIFYDEAFNCRSSFTVASCTDLANDIEQHGQQIPAIVQPREDVEFMPARYDFRLVVGHRRFIAITKILQLGTIKAEIRKGLTDQEARILNLVENIHRQNLSLIDEAHGIRAIFPRQVSWDKMAEAVNRGRTWVKVRWTLAGMDPEIQQYVAQGKLTAFDLDHLAYVEPENQVPVAREMIRGKDRGMSSRELNRRLNRRRKARTRTEIHEMMGQMMISRAEVDAFKALAWAAGDITTDEFMEEPDERGRNEITGGLT